MWLRGLPRFTSLLPVGPVLIPPAHSLGSGPAAPQPRRVEGPLHNGNVRNILGEAELVTSPDCTLKPLGRQCHPRPLTPKCRSLMPAGFSPRGGSAEAWVPLPRGEWPAPSTPGVCREGTAWGRSYPHLLTHPGVLFRVCAGAQSETCELESGGPCSRQPGVPMGGSREGATGQENMRCRKLSDLTDLGQEVTRRRSDTRAVTEKASKQGGQEGGGQQAARDDLQGPGGRARSVASP